MLFSEILSAAGLLGSSGRIGLVISSRPCPDGISCGKPRILNVNTKLYIGNLSADVTENSLNELFSKKGLVVEVKLMLDASTGRSRGFAFVTMATPEAAKAALEAFHSHRLGERYITVHEARPDAEKPATGLIGNMNNTRSGFPPKLGRAK